VSCIAQIHHTAPSLRLFVRNSLTVHPRSFSLNAVLAASSFFCPAQRFFFLPVVLSPAATSAPSLRPSHLKRFPANMPEDPVVSHSVCPHSCQGGWCFYITGSSSIHCFLFHFGGGRTLHKVQSLSCHNLPEDPAICFAIFLPTIS
jgi:hypothetical protein